MKKMLLLVSMVVGFSYSLFPTEAPMPIAVDQFDVPVHDQTLPQLNQGLNQAIRNLDKGKVAAYLLVGIDVNLANANGNTALHIAVGNKGAQIFVGQLLNNGANVNIKNNLGMTPLHVAVVDDNTKIAAALLKKGADASCCRNDAMAPVHFAKSLDMAKLLLDNGANINALDPQGLTPLHVAVIEKRLPFIHEFLKRGADITCLALNGDTLLHSICRDHSGAAQTVCIKLLFVFLRKGIDVVNLVKTVVNKDHQTVYDLASTSVKKLFDELAAIPAKV